MKLRNLIIAGAIAGSALTGLSMLGGNAEVSREANQKYAETCIRILNSDVIKGKPSACGKVNLQALPEEKQAEFATAEAKYKKEKAEADAKQKAKQEAERKAAAAAQAKFEAEGWFELSKGIYGRWCTNTCNKAEVIGNSSYWLMEVWAKDRAAGDIYAQINIMQNGVVTGWTNDTAFLDKGQRGVLTFQKYGLSNGAAYQAQLTKFNARGSW
ncbi:hypothetical protein [Synechococcus sp. MEDNS5]|uniref:hypothetical protein n=1 Tax=Synechococcus sp. MEDNS5 TaxID=1442554 RepID=UPI001647DF0D|nr:hypothetical protein [Synechococcus sp. MEDNS5]